MRLYTEHEDVNIICGFPGFPVILQEILKRSVIIIYPGWMSEYDAVYATEMNIIKIIVN